MPNAKSYRSKRLDPRGPLVFDIRALGPASARAETREVAAPADLGAGLIRVPVGAVMELDVLLEEVSEGVLVTVTVTAPLAGECARCLEPFSSSIEVGFQELYVAGDGGSGPDGYLHSDGYLLSGDLLDLEPALRDALVLELPLSPLCAGDCPGLCSTCGIRLADAEPGHRHADDGGVWAVLKNLFPDGDPPSRKPEESSDGTAGPVGTKEH